ncbi:MAG TPA: M1 family aminopeptidase, partial [Nitrospiraceae bacterium]
MKTPSQTVVFTLAPMLKVESILMTTRTAPSDQSTQAMRAVPYTSEFLTEPPSQKISISLPVPHDDTVTLVWTYRGPINDPPREPRHLRFVTPSETSGYIGSEGVYLSSESQWYPQPEGSSLNRFRVKTTLPVGWKAVTLGKAVSERTENAKAYSEWNVRDETEALTLVANRFVVASRNWTGPDEGTIELSTYFLSDNAGLADEYLDATEKYLKAYIPILGPYPFEKFAVVENFFASGLGMPSFTLLGSGSIKRHYVQPYALGHEIVHSWIGNSVFNRIDGGNWVEGLTTYLANYYWHELVNDQVQARDQRRQMVEGYNLYVPPERDYPVAEFRQKRDERDNAIGYQKAAMTFYHLRAEVGDQVFWRALRSFVSQYRGRFAEWRDVERVWAMESGQNLRWFFVQWVERPGAPNLAVTDVLGRTGRDGKEPYEVVVSVDQTDPPARTAIPIRVQLENGHEQTVVMPVRAARETVVAALPARPMR